MVKTFRAYLPANSYRKYSCVHCRAHLASHDDLISKVRAISYENSLSWSEIHKLFKPWRLFYTYLFLLVFSRQPRESISFQFSVSHTSFCCCFLSPIGLFLTLLFVYITIRYGTSVSLSNWWTETRLLLSKLLTLRPNYTIFYEEKQ